VQYLVAPRVVSVTLLAPLLDTFAIIVGIAAGFSLAIYGLGAEGHYLWQRAQASLTVYDFFTGLTKVAIFSGVMALICCRKGLETRGGAEGVGRAATAANVESCVYILMLNLVLTMVLYYFDPRRR
jgi:phospholipid/cholesterol/gamma-HCH transport system permease protein